MTNLDGYTGANWLVSTATTLLHSRAGQTVTHTHASPHDDVSLIIYDITGRQPLVRSVTAQTTWTGKLPQNQDNFQL